MAEADGFFASAKKYTGGLFRSCFFSLIPCAAWPGAPISGKKINIGVWSGLFIAYVLIFRNFITF
jgi:hypothetical protein